MTQCPLPPITSMIPEAIPFALAVAFSRDPFGGNPAAVVFMDLTQPAEIYEGIAKNLKQPMIAFVKAKETIKPGTAAFSIRFFTPYNVEVPLCGHATLVAAGVIFKDPNTTSDIDVLEFEAQGGKILSARKIGDGYLEVRFPSGMPEEVSGGERARLVPHINKAFDREVAIRYIGKDRKNGHYGDFLLVEIDAKEDLKNSVVDPDALRGTGYACHMITSASTTGQELFISRMFAPGIISDGEDMVCGAGHCIAGPYWYRKHGVPAGDEVKATQVSPRGGELKLVWLEGEGTMVLRGMSTAIGRGELYV